MKFIHCIKRLFIVIILLQPVFIQAQVGINQGNNDPDPSAMLDVQSTTKGMLIPRMDSVQRVSIPSPATGLMVFQTDGAAGFYYYTGSSWDQIGKADASWEVDGANIHNTNSGNVGIGTTTPDAALDVEGSLQVQDGTEGEGKLLTSDADGNASWQQLKAESLFENGVIPDPDFSCMSVVGSLAIWNSPTSVVVSGEYAYVTDFMNDDLKVIDVSDPATPTLSGSLGSLDGAEFLAVSGNYAYLLEYIADSMIVIDVSKPANPMIVGGITIGTRSEGVVVSGNYIYIIDSDIDELMVIDVSDPTSPIQIGSMTLGSNPQAIAVSGNYAYVVDAFDDDMKVIDLSDPANPSLSGSLAMGSRPVEVAISGNYAYVIDSNTDDMRVVDVSDPTNPILTGSLGMGAYPRSIAVSGTYAYVVDSGSEDLKVIDISDPANPVLNSSLGIGKSPLSIAVVGKYAYVTDGNADDLKVIELSCSFPLALDPLSGTIIETEMDNLGNHIATQHLDLGSNNLIHADTVNAAYFSGDGSTLTNLPGDDLGNHQATQTFDLDGNDITNADTVNAAFFSGDGSALTNLPGDDLGNHQATQTFDLDGNDITNADTVNAAFFSGDGSALTNLPGDDLGNHQANQTLDLDGNTLINADTVNAAYFAGDGSALTNLPGDGLGNHQATTDIQLAGNKISNNGGNFAMDMNNNGQVNISSTNGSNYNVQLQSGNTPTLRLYQNGSGGYSSILWDVGGNETNLFFRETSTTGNLPFKLRAGSSDNRLVIDGEHVGIGVNDPQQRLDVDGKIRMREGASEGFVPISDSVGNMSWTSPSVLADNLGNHTLDSNLMTNGHYISRDGEDEGIMIDDKGRIGINTQPYVDNFDADVNLSMRGMMHIQDDNPVLWFHDDVGNGERGLFLETTFNNSSSSNDLTGHKLSLKFFSTGGKSGNVDVPFVFRADGRMGVNLNNNANPSRNLSVIGDGYFTTKLSVGQKTNNGSSAFSVAGSADIKKALASANGVTRLLTLDVHDNNNIHDLAAGSGTGILFKIPVDNDSKIGAAVDAVRTSGTDNQSHTALIFSTSQNNETLNEAMRIDNQGKMGIATPAPNSTLHVEGSVSVAIKTLTASYTATDEDYVLVGSFGSNTNNVITLPDATSCKGRIYLIKKSFNSPHFPVVVTSQNQVIDGVLAIQVSSQVQLISDGFNWQVISN